MFKDTDRKLGLILMILAFLMYANTLGHDYAWDDSIVITENARVKKGLIGIPDLFLKYNSDYKSDKYGYRPIVLSSYALEYSFFGPKPVIGHLMNVVYFALLCFVMYDVLRKILYRLGNLAPFLITTLFIVHPVHVEVVANIKSRDEIFALLFSLLSLKQFIFSQKKGNLPHLLLGSLYFICALLSKEGAITFLAIVPLTLFYMEDKPTMRVLVKPALACLVLGIAGYFIYRLYTGSALGVKASENAGIFYESGIIGNSFMYTYWLNERIANGLLILLYYLKNFIYPVNLIYFYGYNQIPVANWHQGIVWISLLIHLCLLFFAIFYYRSSREISYGILFYFTAISMYTHIVRTLADTMSDRFLFTPSLGLCLITVCLITKILKIDLRSATIEKWTQAAGNKAMQGFRFSFSVIFFLLAIATFSRNKVWKNDQTLIVNDLPKMENCSRAHFYYADVLKRELALNYNQETENKMIHHFRRSYGICKEAYYAYLSLGTYFCAKGDYDSGIAILDTMVLLFPGSADPHFYLGEAFTEKGNHMKAIDHLETSKRLAANVLSTYITLAIAYSESGNFEKANATITEAKEKFPDSARMYEVLGIIYYNKGDGEQSAKYTLEKLRFGEDPQKVYQTVIGRFQVLKQDSMAALYYRQAVASGVFKDQH